MHGRVRVKTTEEKEAQQKAAKAEKLKSFQTAVGLLTSNQNLPADKLLHISSRLLSVQPDLSLAWSTRKSNKDSLNLEQELFLTYQCLQENPKSYGAWFHRRWSLENLPHEKSKTSKFECFYQEELKTVDQYLQFDDRNFHAWDHRRWVVEKLNKSIEEELLASRILIERNFSNHSAWHYRSSLLLKKYPETIPPEIIQEEIDFVSNAFYVEPNDSAGWIYYDWLISLVTDETMIKNQLENLNELNTIEPDSKYIILHLVRLDPDGKSKSEWVEKLKEIDPLRTNYYSQI